MIAPLRDDFLDEEVGVEEGGRKETLSWSERSGEKGVRRRANFEVSERFRRDFGSMMMIQLYF